MGLFIVHTEDNQYHMYTFRSITLVRVCTVIAMLSFISGFYMVKVQNNQLLGPLLFVPFAILALLSCIDSVPIQMRRRSARGIGNKIIEEGNPFTSKPYILKIEKKGIL